MSLSPSNEYRDLLSVAAALSQEQRELDRLLVAYNTRVHLDCDCDIVTDNPRLALLLILRWLASKVYHANPGASAPIDEVRWIWALTFLMVESGVYHDHRTYAELFEMCEAYAQNWNLLAVHCRRLIEVTPTKVEPANLSQFIVTFGAPV